MKQTDVRGGFSEGLGAPPPGRPNGSHACVFSAKRIKSKLEE